MKKHTIYRVLGLLCILIPFFGFFEYLKDFLYISIGLFLIFITKKDKNLKEENTSFFEESKEVIEKNTDSLLTNEGEVYMHHLNENVSLDTNHKNLEVVKVRKPRAKKIVNNI